MYRVIVTFVTVGSRTLKSGDMFTKSQCSAQRLEYLLQGGYVVEVPDEDVSDSQELAGPGSTPNADTRPYPEIFLNTQSALIVHGDEKLKFVDFMSEVGLMRLTIIDPVNETVSQIETGQDSANQFIVDKSYIDNWDLLVTDLSSFFGMEKESFVLAVLGTTPNPLYVAAEPDQLDQPDSGTSGNAEKENFYPQEKYVLPDYDDIQKIDIMSRLESMRVDYESSASKKALYQLLKDSL